ncbi:MAG: hypothetical protein WA759_20370 [Pseudolabrys sp.]
MSEQDCLLIATRASVDLIEQLEHDGFWVEFGSAGNSRHAGQEHRGECSR